MDHDAERDAARLLSQTDQIAALVGQMVTAFGRLHSNLIDEKVPRHVANKIAQDAAHQWFAGTFNKPPSFKFPGMP